MLQVDSHIWNQIAPAAQHQVWKDRMEAPDNQALAKAMDDLADKLRKLDQDNPVILAYQAVAPLLQENRAINDFTRKNPQYRTALPEVLSTNEALLLAMKEYTLTDVQTRKLRALLNVKPPI